MGGGKLSVYDRLFQRWGLLDPASPLRVHPRIFNGIGGIPAVSMIAAGGIAPFTVEPRQHGLADARVELLGHRCREGRARRLLAAICELFRALEELDRERGDGHYSILLAASAVTPHAPLPDAHGPRPTLHGGHHPRSR